MILVNKILRTFGIILIILVGIGAYLQHVNALTLYVDVSHLFPEKYDKDKGIIVGDLQLFFDNNVLSELSKDFDNSTEYAICLNGASSVNDELQRVSYNINTFDKYTLGTKYYTNLSCEGSIMHVHSHPTGGCVSSDADIDAFYSQVNNGVVIFGVQCSSTQMIVYTKNDLSRGKLLTW